MDTGFDSFDDDFDLSSETLTLDLDGDGVAESVAQLWDADGDGDKGGYLVESDFDQDGNIDQTYIAYEMDPDADGIMDYIRFDSYTDGWSEEEERDDYQDIADTTIEDFQVTTADDSSDDIPDIVLVGDPSEDVNYWHEQSYPDTCAIVSQEFILDQLTGQDFTEDELRQEAIDKGYYIPDYGTPLDKVGCLLEDHGIEVERTTETTLDELSAKLEQGEKVIVGVDADEIWKLGTSDHEEDYLEDHMDNYGHIPGQDSNHAVQVIGIDYSDPDNPTVILNDPGSPDGQGLTIPLHEFEDAWADSNNYMVATTGNTVTA